MSDFGEEIIDRLGDNSALRNPDNPMYDIINDGIGDWLQNVSDKNFLEQVFLQEATGKYLDLHGKDYGVKRKLDESDESYRNRIVYITLGRLTIDFLREVYEVDLFSYINGFNVNNNNLASDNPYFSKNGFMATASDTVKDILNKKFVIGGEITWL